MSKNNTNNNKPEQLKDEAVIEHVEIEKVTTRTFTYVGAGDQPPMRINFMGKQWFERFKPVEIDEEKTALIAKLVGNKSFEEGEVNPADYYTQDEKEAEKARLRRQKDLEINATVKRKHRTA